MSVSFARAVADGLRHNGVVVHYIGGWESRGNGQTSAYQGMIWHHTASNYGSAYPMLWNGRAGLSGPLCNSSGNADGSITIVAAHPANHAGASGGRSMGPLPVTRSFNKYVWGHEIVYPGTSPMTAEQYRSALVLAGVVCGILRRPNPEWARGHAETSITGKWDPGYANGRTYDLRRMRAEVWGALHPPAPIPPPPPAPKDVDRLTPLTLNVRDNGTFRATYSVECGPASTVINRAWVTFASTWGDTEFHIFALNKDGVPLKIHDQVVANNRRSYIELPPNSLILTVEGRVRTAGAIPAVSLITQPK